MRYLMPYFAAAVAFACIVGYEHQQMPVANAKGAPRVVASVTAKPTVQPTVPPGDLTDAEYDRLDETAYARCASMNEPLYTMDEVPGARQVIVTCGVPKSTFLLRP